MMLQRSNIGFQNDPKFLKKFVSQYEDSNLSQEKDRFDKKYQSNLKPMQEVLPKTGQKMANKFGQKKKDRNKNNLKNLVFDDEDLPDIQRKINDLQSFSNFFFFDLKGKLKTEVVNTSTNLKVVIVNKLERVPKIQVQLIDHYEDFSSSDPHKINWSEQVDFEGEDQVKSAEMQMTIDQSISTESNAMIKRGKMIPEAFPIPDQKSFTMQPSISTDSAETKIKLGETLETEILDIIKLWKYILNLITNIKEDFEVSCRLIKKLSRETFNHHTADLPDWLQNIMEGWYQDLESTLCDDEIQVRGSSLT